MPNKKTTFNMDWVNPNIDKDLADTFREVKGDPFSAFCKLCSKKFSLSNMGKAALKSHQKCAGHLKKMLAKKSTPNVQQALFRQSATELENISSSSTSTIMLDKSTTSSVNGSNTAIRTFFISEEVLEAEILWALHSVESHLSLNSANKTLRVLRLMFKRSEVAEKMKLSPKKLSYLITYGLAPYFQEQLEAKLVKCNFFVACFDESLNRIAQRGQMDICIRYWDEESQLVETRYLKSIFMNGAKATDILRCFKNGLKPLKLEKLLQVSMDGPNVNWKFLRILKEDSSVNILDLGSCGLHVVHGAFQSGHKAAQWSVNEFLRGIYWLFKDSPARRAFFKEITSKNVFPLKFCSVRWVESASAAFRALSIFESISKYMNNENAKLPNTTTVRNVKRALNDKLLKPKIAFFATIASNLEVFLKKYQSNKPLVPFLFKDLDVMIKSLLERIIKKEYLNKSTESLLKLDFNDNNIYVGYNNIDLGFRPKKYLGESKASELEKTIFLKECMKFLKVLIKKLFDRSPLKYKAIKTFRCLDPHNVFSDPTLCKTSMNQLLNMLSDNNLIDIETAELASYQFNTFLNNLEQFRDMYVTYKNDIFRLDKFYSDIFVNKNEFKELFSIVKMVLILFHGNAVVESGFSVNNQMLVENQLETSLVARRQVFDAILNKRGVVNVELTRKMKHFCKNAHARYISALEEKKKIDEEEYKRAEKRKAVVAQIGILEKKKAKINNLANYESKNIDVELIMLRKQI